MPEAAPDPDGEMPAGWDPVRWLAYQRLSTGGHTQREVAHMVDRSTGTMSGWVREWRIRYGDNLFRDAQPAHVNQQRREGLTRGNAVVAARWREVRAVAAGGVGEAARKAQELALAILDDHLADTPDARAKRDALGPADVLQLATAAEKLVKTADRLAGIPDPTAAYRLEFQAAPPPEPGQTGIFDALDDEAADSQSVDMLSEIERALGEYASLRAGSDEEVIDLDDADEAP